MTGTVGRVHRARTLGSVLGGVLALALPFVVLPLTTHTSWTEIKSQFANITVTWLVVLGVVWFAGLVVHTFVSTAALPGLGHRRAMVLNFSGSTVSHLAPFGGVLGMGLNYTMLRSWGFDGGHFTVLTLLTNAYNVLVKLVLPAIALALLLTFTHHSVHGLLPTTLVSLVLLVGIVALARVALRHQSPDDMRRRGRVHGLASAVLAKIAGHPPDEVIHTLRTDVRTVVRQSWRRMSLGMLGYAGMQAALLWMCLLAVGARMSPLAVFAAYSMGSALTLVPVTPGGVGFAEAGSAAILVALGGPAAGAAAAVLLYSTFTRLMEIPFGAAGTALWWIRRPRAATTRPASSF